MRGLPGITVDQEDRVLLRGSDRVTILVDGKPSSLTGFGNQSGLDSIPAGSIESIEIINNPSSRYDSAGMAGIINIVYKREQDTGFHIDAGISIGTGLLSKRKADLPTDLGSFSRNPKITPSVNIVNNTDDMNSFLQAEVLYQDDLPNNEFTTRFYDDGRVVNSQVPENREQVHYIVNGGFDKYLDADRTLSFSSIIDFETHTDVAQVPFINGLTQELNRYWFWREEVDTGYVNLNLSYEREFPVPGHQYSVSMHYTRGWEDEAYFLNEVSPVRTGTDATHLVAEENTLPIQFDYIRPLRRGRLEAGARLQKRWIPITYDVVPGQGSIIYPGLGNWSEWGENIYAAYANYVHEKERYDIEAGFRLEQTDVYYDLPQENIYYDRSDSYDYFEVYPNVRLTYNINDSDRMSVHYNSRVDRPGEPELRIFPKYDDPELLKVGNPYLRPQFTKTFEVAYERLWDSGSIIASLYHRNIDDPFTRVFAIDPTNTNYDIVNKIYQNVGSGSNAGVELIFTQDISSAWELSGSLNVYDNVVDADVVTLLFPVQRPFVVERSADNTWDAKLNNQFEFANGVRVQVSLVYYAEKNIAQGIQAARSSIDFGISKPVFDDRGELVLSVVDLLNDFGIKQTIAGASFNAIYENYYETQVVSLGLNYQF
jgi:outer membrane receptor protein involved in Fe transport